MHKKLFLFALLHAINIGCHDFAYYFHQGHEEFRNNNLEQALAAYDNAIALDPTCHQAYFNKGLVLTAQARPDEALRCYEKAVGFAPRYEKAHILMGGLYLEKNEPEKALSCFCTALELNPENVDALSQLAKTYIAMQRINDALLVMHKAAQLDQHNTMIQLDYANMLTMNNQFQEALTVYQTLLEKNPHNTIALYNTAYTLKKMNDVHNSLPYYYRVLEMVPDDAEAHFGLSLAHLVLGNLEEGWKEYEWRWRREGFEPRTLPQPTWKGEPLAGKTLFIHAEQGLGDTLQFVRYAKVAHDMGATVHIAVQEPLVPLLSLCPYLDKVTRLHDPITSFDYHIALLSMPYVCRTTLASIPHEIPYLYARDDLQKKWHDTLAQDPNIKIGICWQGNAHYSTPFLRHTVAAKSMPVSLFAPLARIPGVSLYSLQKVSGTDQLNSLDDGFILHQFDDEFDVRNGRFMDTASVITQLDLVITIDTSICHLAGGLGTPVWLLLPNPADWRWLLERNDSPWYPGMKLFRQPTPGDWHSVINTLVHELEHSITYYEQDSHLTQIVDKAALFSEHAESINDPLQKQAIRAHVFGLKRKAITLHNKELEILIDELEKTDQEILSSSKMLAPEKPFNEQYARRVQYLTCMIQKRESLKQHINALVQKGQSCSAY